jgi:hypothetical protein
VAESTAFCQNSVKSAKFVNPGFISAAPPSTHSSSSDGVLWMLKSMFAWCRDTRQRQDVILSNQRRISEKMGIEEFSSPVPPLDDDPFASLSTGDIVAMEAADDNTEDGSGSEYEESDSLLRLDFLLFLFWCLDAKGGEESIYLAILISFLFGLWLVKP